MYHSGVIPESQQLLLIVAMLFVGVLLWLRGSIAPGKGKVLFRIFDLTFAVARQRRPKE